MAKRRALGKGLGALIPQVPAEGKESESKLREMDISQIVPNPEQPRKVFDEEALKELAESIKNQGLLQPLVVREFEGNYQIVVGERRWRASQLAGLRSVLFSCTIPATRRCLSLLWLRISIERI